MKEILLTLLYYLLIKISSQDTIFTLNKYKSFKYNKKGISYAILESINIEGKEIEITYEIQNGTFSNASLYYYYINNKLEDDNYIDKNKLKGPIYSKKNETSKIRNNQKTCFRIKKDKKYKYLILQNLPNNDGKTIEVKNHRTTKKTVIIIFIISLIIICGIIAAFLFVGKYIYSQRQKEVMANYATSFVAENPGLLPNDENNAIIDNNEKIIENNEKRDSHIKIDD